MFPVMWSQVGFRKSDPGAFLPGGVSHGPRGPTSYYYMLPMKVRVQGLKVALSSKMAQVTSKPSDHCRRLEL